MSVLVEITVLDRIGPVRVLLLKPLRVKIGALQLNHKAQDIAGIHLKFCVFLPGRRIYAKNKESVEERISMVGF